MDPGDGFVLQSVCPAVGIRDVPSPTGLAHTVGADPDARLLAKLPHGCVDVRFACFYATARELPRCAERRVVQVTGVKEQNVIIAVEHHEPHNTALDTADSMGKGVANMQRLPLTSELNKAYTAPPAARYGYGVVFSPKTQRYYYAPTPAQPTQ